MNPEHAAHLADLYSPWVHLHLIQVRQLAGSA